MIAQYHRELRCMPGCMKCCCFQEVQVKDASGLNIGQIRELQWAPFVPKFGLFNATGDVQTHVVHPPTCLGGVCINCCAEGLCSCRQPFYIYDVANDVEGSQVSAITKIWSGFKKELFSDAAHFEVTFPSTSDGKTKATIRGVCCLLNQLFYESQPQQQ